jgi:hypothetical protein
MDQLKAKDREIVELQQTIAEQVVRIFSHMLKRALIPVPYESEGE